MVDVEVFDVNDDEEEYKKKEGKNSKVNRCVVRTGWSEFFSPVLIESVIHTQYAVLQSYVAEI